MAVLTITWFSKMAFSGGCSLFAEAFLILSSSCHLRELRKGEFVIVIGGSSAEPCADIDSAKVLRNAGRQAEVHWLRLPRGVLKGQACHWYPLLVIKWKPCVASHVMKWNWIYWAMSCIWCLTASKSCCLNIQWAEQQGLQNLQMTAALHSINYACEDAMATSGRLLVTCFACLVPA